MKSALSIEAAAVACAASAQTMVKPTEALAANLPLTAGYVRGSLKGVRSVDVTMYAESERAKRIEGEVVSILRASGVAIATPGSHDVMVGQAPTIEFYLDPRFTNRRDEFSVTVAMKEQGAIARTKRIVFDATTFQVTMRFDRIGKTRSVSTDDGFRYVARWLAQQWRKANGS